MLRRCSQLEVKLSKAGRSVEEGGGGREVGGVWIRGTTPSDQMLCSLSDGSDTYLNPIVYTIQRFLRSFAVKLPFGYFHCYFFSLVSLTATIC